MALRSESGFSVVELIVLVVGISLLAFVGFTVYSRKSVNKDSNVASLPSERVTKSEVPNVPEVSSAQDLDKATATLDSIDIESGNYSDSAQLDQELQGF